MITDGQDIRLVMGERDAYEARDWMMNSVLIANDIETNPKLVLMTVNGYCGLHENGAVRTYVFPMYNSKSPASGLPVHLPLYLRIMQEINDSPIPMTLHNGPYDMFWHARYNMPIANYAYDSMSMFWSLYPELPKTLSFVSSVMLDDHKFWKGDRKSDDWTTHLIYNGKDCNRTLRITLKLINELIENTEARMNWSRAHRRVITSLGMSMRGMNFDPERIEVHHAALKEEADKALERLRYIVADPEFNPNSPAQKKRLIYEILGAPLRNDKGKAVKRIADASSGAVAMRSIRNEHPIVRRIVDGIKEAGEPAKQISNVIGIRKAPWGRVYTGYNGVGTTTERLSSGEPAITYGSNLQNIRKKFRDWIIADDDSVIYSIDLSAGDDVFVSFESGDPEKIQLFRSGLDSHAKNATLFFPNWTYEEVVAGKRADDPRVTHPITGIRQITKKLSHGCNYLMAALTLLMTAGRDAIVAAAKEWGHEDAHLWNQDKLLRFCEYLEMLYRNHYTRFKRSGANSWYSELAEQVRRTGGFLTPFFYFQRFLGSSNDQGTIRAVAATAGQAGTAGRINMVMDELDFGYIPPRFRDAPNPCADDIPGMVSRKEHGISMRLQTHDSLDFNINLRHENWREGVRRIDKAFSRPVIIRNSQTGLLEEFVVGTEREVGLAWGKGLHEIKNPGIEAFEKTLMTAAPDLYERLVA